MKIISLQNSVTACMKIGALAAIMQLSACASSPDVVGINNDELKPCPSSPNCVSTADKNSHSIASFNLAIPPGQAIEAIATELNKLPRVKIATQEERYLRAEFTSAIFRFVDDVEFYVHEDGKLSVRSASRVGYSDLGENRSRVEKLRTIFRDKAIIR